MASKSSDVFIGRQPVFDRRNHVVAYELLFRSGQDREAHIIDDSLATSQVIHRAFRDLGLRTVVGARRAFINVDAPTLMRRDIELLPADRVVIELLETIEVDKAMVKRCRELKAKGYRLALDDFVRYGTEYEPLLEIVDIVKIDVPALSRSSLANLVDLLHDWRPKLLAEKVETSECARDCLALGFNLFQGFFFARPVIL
jgi:EAL and modified HD-GYP domain-containing signal transduction protein